MKTSSAIRNICGGTMTIEPDDPIGKKALDFHLE